MSQPQSIVGHIRRFPLATIGVVLLLGLLVGLFLRWDDLGEAKTILAEKQAISKRNDLNVRNGVGLAKHLEALKSGVTALESKLIRVDDIGTNQQYFYAQEVAAGVKLSVLRVVGVSRGQEKGALYQRVAYNVVVEGRFPQILAFLQGLELGEKHYRMVSFTLQRGGSGQVSGGAAPSVTLNLNLELLASS